MALGRGCTDVLLHAKSWLRREDRKGENNIPYPFWKVLASKSSSEEMQIRLYNIESGGRMISRDGAQILSN